MERNIGRVRKVYIEAELGMLLGSMRLSEGSNCHVLTLSSLALMLRILSDERMKLWIEKTLVSGTLSFFAYAHVSLLAGIGLQTQSSPP